MRIKNGLTFGVEKLSKETAEISREAGKRVKWFDFYTSPGKNARLTCLYLGISPQPSTAGKIDMTANSLRAWKIFHTGLTICGSIPGPQQWRRQC
jgi:hypothetical protein